MAPALITKRSNIRMPAQRPEHSEVATPRQNENRNMEVHTDSNSGDFSAQVGNKDTAPQTTSDPELEAAQILLSFGVQPRVDTEVPEIQNNTTSSDEQRPEPSNARKRKFHDVYWSDTDESGQGTGFQRKMFNALIDEDTESSSIAVDRQQQDADSSSESEDSEDSLLVSKRKQKKSATNNGSAAKENKVYRFELPTPEAAQNPQLNKPDPSKFKMTLRYRIGDKKGQLKSWDCNPSLVISFNWGSKKCLRKLKSWRQQLVYRKVGPRRVNSRPYWTVTEEEILKDIIADHMTRVEHKRQLDWEEITQEFNDATEGLTACVGELHGQTKDAAPRPDPFGMSEPDITEILMVPFARGPSETQQGRQRQRYWVTKEYQYGERVVGGVVNRAKHVQSIIDVMERVSFDDDLTDVSSDSELDSDEESDYDYGDGTNKLIAATRRVYPIHSRHRWDTRVDRYPRTTRDTLDLGEEHGQGPSLRLTAALKLRVWQTAAGECMSLEPAGRSRGARGREDSSDDER